MLHIPFLSDAYELLLNELRSTLQSFGQKPILVIFLPVLSIQCCTALPYGRKTGTGYFLACYTVDETNDHTRPRRKEDLTRVGRRRARRILTRATWRDV